MTVAWWPDHLVVSPKTHHFRDNYYYGAQTDYNCRLGEHLDHPCYSGFRPGWRRTAECHLHWNISCLSKIIKGFGTRIYALYMTLFVTHFADMSFHGSYFAQNRCFAPSKWNFVYNDAGIVWWVVGVGTPTLSLVHCREACVLSPIVIYILQSGHHGGS